MCVETIKLDFRLLTSLCGKRQLKACVGYFVFFHQMSPSKTMKKAF